MSMSFLIDTHVLIWYLDGNNKLEDKIRERINDEQNIIVVSIASLWELAIKQRLGKLNTKITLSEIQNHIIKREFKLLNISFQHLGTLDVLPHHHGDPFDHMLIAQAISENLTIISADRHFDSYPVKVIW